MTPCFAEAQPEHVAMIIGMAVFIVVAVFAVACKRGKPPATPSPEPDSDPYAGLPADVADPMRFGLFPPPSPGLPGNLSPAGHAVAALIAEGVTAWVNVETTERAIRHVGTGLIVELHPDYNIGIKAPVWPLPGESFWRYETVTLALTAADTMDLRPAAFALAKAMRPDGSSNRVVRAANLFWQTVNAKRGSDHAAHSD